MTPLYPIGMYFLGLAIGVWVGYRQAMIRNTKMELKILNEYRESLNRIKDHLDQYKERLDYYADTIKGLKNDHSDTTIQ